MRPLFQSHRPGPPWPCRISLAYGAHDRNRTHRVSCCKPATLIRIITFTCADSILNKGRGRSRLIEVAASAVKDPECGPVGRRVVASGRKPHAACGQKSETACRSGIWSPASELRDASRLDKLASQAHTFRPLPMMHLRDAAFESADRATPCTVGQTHVISFVPATLPHGIFTTRQDSFVTLLKLARHTTQFFITPQWDAEDLHRAEGGE